MNRALLFLSVAAFAQACAPPIPDGAISGEIRTLDGTPARNIRVEAQSISNPRKTPIEARTDNAGRYRLSVPVGDYRVMAAAGEARSYFPGAKDAAHARAVTVRPGADTEAVDFMLGGVRVSGRVRGVLPTGIPDGLIHVEMFSSGESSRDAPIKADGTFEFFNVPPGDLSLDANVLGAWAGSVHVQMDDVDDIELIARHTTAESWLLGQILVEVEERLPSDPDVSKPSIRVEARQADGLFTSRFVQSDGIFGFPALPEGEYEVRLADVPKGYKVQSVTYGDTDLLHAPLKIVAGARPAFMEVVLAATSPTMYSKATSALILSKTGRGPGYVEGKETFFRVSSGNLREERRIGGDFCFEERLLLKWPAAKTGLCMRADANSFDSLPLYLPVGQYELASYVRARMGGRPDDKCRTEFTIRENETIYVERVERGRACDLKVSSKPFR